MIDKFKFCRYCCCSDCMNDCKNCMECSETEDNGYGGCRDQTTLDEDETGQIRLM